MCRKIGVLRSKLVCVVPLLFEKMVGENGQSLVVVELAVMLVAVVDVSCADITACVHIV
jgi:hypothetical protein